MTLVVARKIGSEIRMFADARLSYPDHYVSTPLRGGLKLVAINDVCIGYAGEYVHAVDALRKIKNLGYRDFGQITDVLFEAHKECGGKVDFVLATYIPLVSLIKISNGEVIFDIDSAWIGDPDAFSEYQRIYHTLPESPKSEDHSPEESEFYETISRMSSALGDIVRENKLDSVGEFTISVRSTSSGFKYLGGAMAFIVEQKIPSGEPTALKFGTAQQGGYAYTVMTPTSPNVGAIGVYFVQGNLGVLYHPLAMDEAIVYPKESFDSFKSSVLKDYGFSIDGIRYS